MLDRIITYSFYLLFFLTPLFWTSLNYELFEYNKMILTYGFTTLIVGTWILKMIQQQAFILKRTPLDIPLLLFLGANILSTIFSIDTHTSIWGYYSRSNGGLLSIISYLLLYWAFVSNMEKRKVLTTLKFALASGLIISLWGILEHFGVSPSCIILRGDFDVGCWVQDVQARVFATLGQPNWMAGYLGMLIFPSLYFFLTAKTRILQTTYYLLLTTYYLAFTFTYSRGPTLGLLGGMAVFTLFLSFSRKRESIKLMTVLGSFLIINLLFGSALTNFRLVSKFAAPPRPSIALPTTSVTQLETGGTESGQIRFIVWKGAWDIFRHYPVFGSGVETFAHIYYQFRPPEHNNTSEWDFLYNKAHNEYLNYLSTTGVVGLGTYSIIIITFITFILRKQNSNRLLLLAILASYISYLIYNFFLFSVVILALFFYLFPALAFVATESTNKFQISNFKFQIFNLIYRRSLYTKLAKGVVIFFTIYLLYSIFQLWYADTIFSLGQRASELGNPGRAYNLLTAASHLNKGEPLYRSELSFAAAQAAAALYETDATLAAELKDQAVYEMEKVLRENPKNVSYYRTAVRTYFELGILEKTLITLNKAIALSPTDPKLYYNKALILRSLGKKDEEVKVLQQALKLKPNYPEVLEQLKEAI